MHGTNQIPREISFPISDQEQGLPGLHSLTEPTLLRSNVPVGGEDYSTGGELAT